jgi:hypothetical protein
MKRFAIPAILVFAVLPAIFRFDNDVLRAAA